MSHVSDVRQLCHCPYAGEKKNGDILKKICKAYQ